MAIARRAPMQFMDGADLLLASLIVKHSMPDPATTTSFADKDGDSLAILITEDTIIAAYDLMIIAKTMNRLRNMARWLGKGGKLVALDIGGFVVELPEAVQSAVNEYERRRERDRFLGDTGFFVSRPVAKKWSEYKLPMLAQFDVPQMIEAPLDSQRWLSFERLALMRDGGGIARVLRAYETPLVEVYGVGTDPILHSLTALAVLISDNTSQLVSSGDKLAFAPEPTTQATQHKIEFTFALSRKGFLRFSRAQLISHFGRVHTPQAPDQKTSETLSQLFIDAFI